MKDILDILKRYTFGEDSFPPIVPRNVIVSACTEIEDLRKQIEIYKKQVEFYKDYLLDREHMRFF